MLDNVEDLESAFHSTPLKRVVNLWCECEDKDEEPGPPKSQHRKMSQREAKESMADEIVQELKEKNDENYTVKPDYSGHPIRRPPLYKSHVCVNQ